jgi:two-component system, NtrC family, response regulator AtoC
MSDPVIFIVDSNQVHSNLLRYNLSMNKFTNTQTFTSAEECFYRLRKQAEPDFIIAEYELGEYNGYEFLKMVKRMSPMTHVIFFTSVEDQDLAIQLIDAGATDYILKRSRFDGSVRELVQNLQFIRTEISARKEV